MQNIKVYKNTNIGVFVDKILTQRAKIRLFNGHGLIYISLKNLKIKKYIFEP